MPSINGIKTSVTNAAQKVGPRIKRSIQKFPEGVKQFKDAPRLSTLELSLKTKAAKAKLYRAILFDRTAGRLERRVKLDRTRFNALQNGLNKRYSIKEGALGLWNHAVGYVDMAIDLVMLPFKLLGKGFKGIKNLLTKKSATAS